MSINIKKIKIKDGVEIEFSNKTLDDKTTKDTKFKSFIEPHSDFTDALDELDDDVIEILELPADYKEGLKVNSVSIAHEDAGFGCVISCTKQLANLAAPFCLNTPYIPPHRNEHQTNFINGNLQRKIEQLMREASLFMFENKSAQLELDFNKGA